MAGAVLAAALATVPQSAAAQFHTVELTPTFGYLFGGKVGGSSGEYQIESDISYGGVLSFRVRSGGWVDLTYIRQDSEAYLQEFGNPARDKLFDLGTNYFFIGGRQEAPRQGPAIPFFNFNLGTTNLSPKDTSEYQSIWKFAFMAGVGAKWALGNRVMLNTQIRAIGTTLWGGTGFWCGFGGCSIGVSGNAMWQGEILAGLVIPLGR